jgi:O-Antigen ligase
MTQLWHSSLSSPVRTAQPEDDTSPIQGYGIRWKTLTRAEQVVCASIVLIPFWWILGWNWTLPVFVVGITIHDILRYSSLRLKRPTLAAGTLLTFGLYALASKVFHASAITPNIITGPVNLWICGGFILWYLQSNDIGVRPKVIAWAFTIIVIPMLLLWLTIHFVLSEAHYTPLRSIAGLLLDRGENFVNGTGNGNYLIPYWPEDRGLFGLSRFSCFFSYPESFALLVGFMSLLFLDVRNRLWSLLLFATCLFLLMLSGTRSVWISLSLVLAIRYLFITGQAWGKIALFALVGIVSFTVLTVPPITDFVEGTYAHTQEATGDFRKDSTKVRNELYRRTLDALGEDLVFGHGGPGPLVIPQVKTIAVGTHSFILGSLLYQLGLIGTGLFTVFWASLTFWLYQTGGSRPVCCLLTILLFTLVSGVMEFESVRMSLVLLCTLLKEPNSPTRGLRNA